MLKNNNFIKIINKVEDIEHILHYFKEDLPSLREGRVHIQYFAKKIHKFGNLCVFCENGVIKGFIAFYANDNATNNGFISMIAVKRQFRGENIGGQILRFAEEFSREKGMFGVNLEVDKSNFSAIKFYNSHGYRVYSETQTSYFMNKNIINRMI